MNVSYQKWPKIPLGEIFKTTSGGTPLSSCKEYYDGGNIPWINSGELNTPFINAAEHFITPIGLKSSSAKMLPVDSVLIAMYGATAGRASLLKIPACVNQAICAVLPSKNYSPLFLKYYLDTIYQHLVDLSSGSARSNLSQEVLQKVKIPFPDLPTQLRIAAIMEWFVFRGYGGWGQPPSRCGERRYVPVGIYGGWGQPPSRCGNGGRARVLTRRYINHAIQIHS